jgi:hypothetical protein
MPQYSGKWAVDIDPARRTGPGVSFPGQLYHPRPHARGSTSYTVCRLKRSGEHAAEPETGRVNGTYHRPGAGDRPPRPGRSS